MTEQNETQPMQYTAGQTITVMRGKTRGQSAEVLAVDSERKAYAVKYPDGTLGVVNAVNVKAPTEATIGEAKLAAEISTLLSDVSDDGVAGQVQAFVSRLEADLPGLGGRISWPAAE
jgi:uncharacterized protein with FMN-binding domain